MPRFFVDETAISEEEIKIVGEDAFHIARALRMAVGDSVVVCDSDGKEYDCELTLIRDEYCLCRIRNTAQGNTEMPISVTLFMALPKGDKLELVIQKAVELGATEIVPFVSSRCIRKTNAEKADRQAERYNRIAKEAAKQCGRSILPEVSLPISYHEMLEKAGKHSLALFCYEGGGTESLKEILNRQTNVTSVAVIVGSEGGFSPEEAAAAKSAGLTMTGLGKRILRCETAPLFALASLCFHFEL